MKELSADRRMDLELEKNGSGSAPLNSAGLPAGSRAPFETGEVEEQWILPRSDQNLVYLQIGDWHFAETPTLIKTVLGSCVSVCLYHPKTGYAAMNHIYMPVKTSGIDLQSDAGKYGITSMELIINEFVKRDIPRTHLQAKVFGGASTFEPDQTALSTAQKNVNFAFQFLREERINLLSHDTGGSRARTIYLDTRKFEVYVKYIERQLVIAQEQKFIDRVTREIKQPHRAEYWGGD